VNCPSCGTGNRADARFCASCGSPLERRCPNGHPVPATARFCDECGVALAESPVAVTHAPASERRLVSVLFADLVGFTTLSESRDAEEVRELLSAYFETCRRLIGLYGGTVEKFIGDAVMAVWGTPVAQEDDAERSVRTALDLVAAVPELDPALKARAGVLTGEAAVTLGAEGEGMVAGDLVNTASRVQALAEPGSVLVGEATKRSSEAAIAYADAGSHELKGKAEPVQLWRALRVTASRGGAVKTDALEPPFVGRDRELRLVKELFHASAEERRPHLVSIVGIAGIGKSRLAWEFEKYMDGLADTVFWHRGRCLAYGEGVAYWALAEMLRMRTGITEEDPPDAALAKLRATVEEHIADSDERSWLEPRLAHLLGLAERTAPDREDLFSGWRLFFERLAERNPTVLVFEDLQWADAALLDFVEYLLEWSRGHPLYVLALARPELGERRPGFGSASRNATTLALEPLTTAAMEALLDGFVPGLGEDLRAQILDRAEGVPLYAVETVRMLLGRGLLEREGDVYRTTGTVEALEVPETLHALLAARLDGLDAEERRIVQDAAVLGKTFTKAGLVALSGLAADELDPIVTGLVRKEILSVQSDPRSPERGQYTFLQDLLRRVAYETLARKERKARHLAAAGHLEQAWASAEQEVVEVVAAHYLDAYRVAPDAEDAGEIKARARERLVRAGERSASLAASEEAQRYFEQAAELCDEPVETAELLEKSGLAAISGNRTTEARPLLERSIALFRGAGATHPAARVSARLGFVLWGSGELAEGARQAEEAFAVLADDEPDEDLADLAAELGRLRFFLGELDAAAVKVDRALEIAEAQGFPRVLAEGLNTKHLVLDAAGRCEEALGLLERALEIAREHDLPDSHSRALFNLAYQMTARDRFADAKAIDLEGLELSRRRGVRAGEANFLMHLGPDHLLLGEWDEVLRVAAELEETGSSGRWHTRLMALPMLLVSRGQVAEARRELERDESARTDEVQARVMHALAEAVVLRAEGKPREALELAEAALGERGKLQERHPFFKHALVEAVEAAFDLDDLDKVTELLAEWERMRPVDRTPLLVAHRERFVARLAALRGDHASAERGFRRAAGIFRELQMQFYLAVALLELGELTGEHAALAEARVIFERLQATPWLERAAAALPVTARIGAEAT
jgi:class 3 adenylate cyclase/tetratricopeptide (TPR) repeat protein